MALVSCLKKQY